MPAEHVALYRAYRPRFFGELVGQEHVARTLRHAVARGQVAHAYVFGGPRGTGKTSAARILARAVNCEGTRPEPGEPCGACEPCVAIAQGSALDVVEIDAASNRGIDEIRELRERVRYAATRLRVKAYIIDEAHMLTTEAFNALLKTLEEPPPRTLFVLATTEPHRIPQTILSRCQFFEFRRLSLEQVVRRLEEVCRAEGIDAEAAALHAIARHARGGLRDALALLDQARTLDERGRVSVGAVYELLGLPEDEALERLTDAAAAGDAAMGLLLIHRLMEQGREPRQVLLAWMEHLRHVLLLQVAPAHAELLPVPSERLPRLREQAARLDPAALRDLVAYLAERDAALRGVTNARLLLEAAYLAAMARLAPRERPGAAPPTAADAGPSPAAPAGPAAAAAGTVDAPARSSAVPAPATQRPAPPPSPGARVAAPEEIAAAPVAASAEPLRAPAGPLTLEAVEAVWARALEQVRRRSKPAHAILIEGRPFRVDGHRLEIAFAHAFHFSACEQPHVRQLLERTLSSLLGRRIAVRPVLLEPEGSRPEDAAQPAGGAARVGDAGGGMPPGPSAEPGPPSGGRLEPGGGSLLEQAVELFGGQFVDPGEGWR